MDLERTPSGSDAADDATTLKVTGFVDMSTSGTLVDAGLRILWDDSDLALDLSEVSFMDASGVAALTALGRTAERMGRTFVLVSASFPVRRILQILDLTHEWSPPRPGPPRPAPQHRTIGPA